MTFGAESILFVVIVLYLDVTWSLLRVQARIERPGSAGTCNDGARPRFRANVTALLRRYSLSFSDYFSHTHFFPWSVFIILIPLPTFLPPLPKTVFNSRRRRKRVKAETPNPRLRTLSLSSFPRSAKDTISGEKEEQRGSEAAV